MGMFAAFKFFCEPVLRRYPGKKTVMLHHGRCGSTVLTNMLHDYPDIDWQGEAFKLGRYSVGVRDKSSLFSAISSYPVKRSSKQFGFEIKPMHLDDFSVRMEEFVDFCEQQGFTNYVTLTRRNLLRKIISSDIGKISRKWHVKLGAPLEKRQIALSVNPASGDYIINRLASLQQEVNSIERITPPRTLRLKYEDDVRDNPSIGFFKLQEFFGLQPKLILPSLQRVNPGPVSELIANFESVARELENTPYEWMLHD